MKSLVDKLYNEHSLSLEEYQLLLENRNNEIALYLQEKADLIRREIYGTNIYIRGLIEVSNICKNNCYYCGIRSLNDKCQRYRLKKEDIIKCVQEGYRLGYRTFVLQGGEDSYYNDDILCDIISSIKQLYNDCAITLSLGERSKESYQKLYNAGADRYLLRHETADSDHYNQLHPSSMSLNKRIECLYHLKDIGYQVGCGFMVGSPFQTFQTLAKDLKFIEEFKPHMCGIGPFIPHHESIFKDKQMGSVDMTCYLLSIIRLIHPSILLPSTTALSTIDHKGREKGILAGANVIMPNLSPDNVRNQYELYDHKKFDGIESAQYLNKIKKEMELIGFSIVVSRGDYKGE